MGHSKSMLTKSQEEHHDDDIPRDVCDKHGGGLGH